MTIDDKVEQIKTLLSIKLLFHIAILKTKTRFVKLLYFFIYDTYFQIKQDVQP